VLHFLGFIILGGIAGWLAGRIMSGEGYGVILDVILGIVGGIIGGWILGAIMNTLGTARPEGIIAEFIVSVIGACILVGALHLIKGEPIRT